jgi:hypothetical protein
VSTDEIWGCITRINEVIATHVQTAAEHPEASSSLCGRMALEVDNLQMQRRHLLRIAGVGERATEAAG